MLCMGMLCMLCLAFVRQVADPQDQWGRGHIVVKAHHLALGIHQVAAVGRAVQYMQSAGQVPAAQQGG